MYLRTAELYNEPAYSPHRNIAHGTSLTRVWQHAKAAEASLKFAREAAARIGQQATGQQRGLEAPEPVSMHQRRLEGERRGGGGGGDGGAAGDPLEPQKKAQTTEGAGLGRLASLLPHFSRANGPARERQVGELVAAPNDTDSSWHEVAATEAVCTLLEASDADGWNKSNRVRSQKMTVEQARLQEDEKIDTKRPRSDTKRPKTPKSPVVSPQSTPLQPLSVSAQVSGLGLLHRLFLTYSRSLLT